VHDKLTLQIVKNKNQLVCVRFLKHKTEY